MRVSRYEKYKDSGINFLDSIPEHWTYSRIKSIGSVNGRVGWKALKASEYVGAGYFFLATPNIKGRDIDYVNVNYITYERFVESPEIILKEDDILLTKDGSTLGTVNIVKNLPGHGTVNSSIGVLRFKKEVNNDYAYFLIVSDYIQNTIRQKKDGMGVPHLFQKDINNFILLIPPFPEQTAIAEYLSTKISDLDCKVALLERRVIYYHELRKSLINETVCRGIDKNAKLKESGIEWIGKIPSHWEVTRLKSLGQIETSSVNKKIEENEDLVKLINYTDIFTNSKREIWNNDDYMVVSANLNQLHSKKLRKGDVLFTPSSETMEDIGVSSVVMEDLTNTLYSYHILRFKFSKSVYLNYKKYMFNNNFVQYYFSKSASGTTRKILGLNTFYNLPVLLPPTIEEQISIASYLDEKTSKIDFILTNIKFQVAILKELRKSLINDVVTGKIKVTEH